MRPSSRLAEVEDFYAQCDPAAAAHPAPQAAKPRQLDRRYSRISSDYHSVDHDPPSVPTTAAVELANWLRGAEFIVDRHNFGYTLLGLSNGRSHIIVKIYFWFEKQFGRMADAVFCVTKAIEHELIQNWGIRATILYDQSPNFFHPASMMEKHGRKKWKTWILLSLPVRLMAKLF